MWSFSWVAVCRCVSVVGPTHPADDDLNDLTSQCSQIYAVVGFHVPSLSIDVQRINLTATDEAETMEIVARS